VRPLAGRWMIAFFLVAASATAAWGSDVPPPVFGGEPASRAFEVWLSNWRNFYAHAEVNKSGVPQLKDKDLPKAFHGIPPKVIPAAGGAASGGVVTEGMGYAIMIEGMMAAQGDKWALKLGLGLARSWLGMVQGTDDASEEPLGGADKNDGSASKANVKPYGVSAIAGLGPAGVSTWKFPRKACLALSNHSPTPCHGSATDGDEDALLGMMYLADALDFPEDFVDLVARNVIAFASADLGFPDMFRTLPDGTRIHVPKTGSQWGGLTPPGGKFKREAGVPDWCYDPGYFSPASYRTFRDFTQRHWRPEFDKYLPPHLNGKSTSVEDLADTFDSAILAGYNILYYSSCESGTVANWVGVKAACHNNDTLSCEGVPWAHTPYVGEEKGNCSASGTHWGSFGAEASRVPWRMAMDYAMYPEESEQVKIYDRKGEADPKIKFNARYYLNRIATQYKRVGKCDGGKLGDCDCDYPGCKANFTQAFPLSAAFEIIDKSDGAAPTKKAPDLVCDNVPHYGQSWWAGFMSWPTFTAFVAPYVETVEVGPGQTFKPMTKEESRTWLHTLSNICDFDNFTEKGHYKIGGAVCQKTYFHASQEVISTMVMSGSMQRLFEKQNHTTQSHTKESHTKKSHAENSHAKNSHAEQSHSEQSHSEETHKKSNVVRLDDSHRPDKDMVIKAALEISSQNKWVPSDHRPMVVFAGVLAVAGLAAAVALFASERRRIRSGCLLVQQRASVDLDTSKLVHPEDRNDNE